MGAGANMVPADTRYGVLAMRADGTLSENPIGRRVVMPYRGGTLEGEVCGFHTGRNILTGATDTWLTVRDASGAQWPVKPQAVSVWTVVS